MTTFALEGAGTSNRRITFLSDATSLEVFGILCANGSTLHQFYRVRFVNILHSLLIWQVCRGLLILI